MNRVGGAFRVSFSVAPCCIAGNLRFFQRRLRLVVRQKFGLALTTYEAVAGKRGTTRDA